MLSGHAVLVAKAHKLGDFNEALLHEAFKCLGCRVLAAMQSLSDFANRQPNPTIFKSVVTSQQFKIGTPLVWRTPSSISM